MVVTAALGKQKQKKAVRPCSAVPAAWLPWLSGSAQCVFLLWRHQCLMGWYQNSLLLGVNFYLLKDCVCVRAHVCMLSSLWLFCDPVDCSPPGSSVHGISQARILEWVPFPPPGDLPARIAPSTLVFPALAGSLPLHHLGSPLKDDPSVLIA